MTDHPTPDISALVAELREAIERVRKLENAIVKAQQWEREACVKIARSQRRDNPPGPARQCARSIENAIQARGEIESGTEPEASDNG